MRNEMAILLLAVPAMWGQSAASPPWSEFSIGPPVRSQANFSRAGIRAQGISLKVLLARAYGMPEHRVIGPDWIANQRYALTAIVSDPADLQPFLQQELAARFHLVARREMKEVAVYVLKPIEGGNPSYPPAAGSAHPTMQMTHATLAEFAKSLADAIQRPVFDETGVEGTFDIMLSWERGNAASLKAAVKEQLGFQLVDDKRSVELLVIEHIEKPEFSK